MKKNILLLAALGLLTGISQVEADRHYKRPNHTPLDDLWDDLNSYTPNITLVKEDLDAKANVNGKDGGGYGDVPLHYAAFYAGLENKPNNVAVIKLLIERGADITAKNAYDRTPLQEYQKGCGKRKANPEIVALLTPAMATPAIKTKSSAKK